MRLWMPPLLRLLLASLSLLAFPLLVTACCFGVSATAQVTEGRLLVRRDPAKPNDQAALEALGLKATLKAGCSGQIELRRTVIEFERFPDAEIEGSLLFRRGEKLFWLEIPSLRLPRTFERCSSPSDDVAQTSCFLGTSSEKNLTLEVAPKNLGFRSPTNREWELPCKEASDALQSGEPGPALLLFVGLREDATTSYASRPLKFSLACCLPNPAGPEPWICPP